MWYRGRDVRYIWYGEWLDLDVKKDNYWVIVTGPDLKESASAFDPQDLNHISQLLRLTK